MQVEVQNSPFPPLIARGNARLEHKYLELPALAALEPDHLAKVPFSLSFSG